MKKILVISEAYPLPENTGSRQRTMHFVRYFKQFADVDLLCSVHDGKEMLHSDIFRNVIHVPLEGQTSELHRNIQFFFYKLPWRILSKYSAVFKKRILKIINEENYDFIFIRYIINAQYFFSLPVTVRNKVCLDVDDVLSGTAYEEMNAVSTKFAFKKRLDFNYMIAYEKCCCDKFGSILFCSQDDLNHVAGVKRANRHVIPNIVNHPLRAVEKDSTESKSVKNHILLFVGALNYKPNYEGIFWFASEIFPEFKKKFHHAKLMIVGRKPTKEVQNLVVHDGVEVCPDVPDVAPYYHESSVVVVPILQGAGTRIKILEAASMNRPVLSTEKGAEGIDFDREEEILLFHDTASFIHQYRKLLDREFYVKVVRKSRAKVEEMYSTKAVHSMMNSILFDNTNTKSSSN